MVLRKDHDQGNNCCRESLAQRTGRAQAQPHFRCCDAWNKLTNQPWTIMPIGLRDWAYRS